VKEDREALEKDFEENHDEWMDKLLAGQPISSFGARQLAEHMRALYNLYKLKQQHIDTITRLNTLMWFAVLALAVYVLVLGAIK